MNRLDVSLGGLIDLVHVWALIRESLPNPSPCCQLLATRVPEAEPTIVIAVRQQLRTRLSWQVGLCSGFSSLAPIKAVGILETMTRSSRSSHGFERYSELTRVSQVLCKRTGVVIFLTKRTPNIRPDRGLVQKSINLQHNGDGVSRNALLTGWSDRSMPYKENKCCRIRMQGSLQSSWCRLEAAR